jgi:hypothetical protein
MKNNNTPLWWPQAPLWREPKSRRLVEEDSVQPKLSTEAWLG